MVGGVAGALSQRMVPMTMIARIETVRTLVRLAIDTFSRSFRCRLKHLSVLEQALAQPRIRNILDGDVIVQRQGCRRGRGLTEDHEDRLHADRTEGDVRTRNT